MTNDKEKEYGSLRLKRDTLNLLRDMKIAFELSYGTTFTYDEFVKQMAASVEDGDAGVWEVYCMQQELRRVAAEVRQNKEKTTKQ